MGKTQVLFECSHEYTMVWCDQNKEGNQSCQKYECDKCGDSYFENRLEMFGGI